MLRLNKTSTQCAFSLDGLTFGEPEQAGALTVLPIFGTAYNGKIAAPRTGLKLARVVGYGRVELKNPSPDAVAIVPLHMGYIQDMAQNHALCRSAFIGPGQTVLFDDACCVQQAQGGYLKESEQWFFVLPYELRDEVLQLRGKANFGKLWPAIIRLNQKVGLPMRGHLELILSRERATLTQFQSRLELLPDQLGALFFIHDRLIGIEVAPTPEYFQEMWMPLVCFSYGVAARYTASTPSNLTPFEVTTLAELRNALETHRSQIKDKVYGWLQDADLSNMISQEEERYCDMRLYTNTSAGFAGQSVMEHGRMIYASMFARTS